MSYLSIEPDISLINKIRKVDLEIPEAISELVANSLDARKKGQKKVVIRIGLEVLNDKDYLYILDNASGMTKEELQDALSLGKTKKGDEHKGVYGLGLKTAAGVIGNKIIIETTTSSTEKIHRAVYDIPEITKSKKWKIPYAHIERDASLFFNHKNTGTVIVITDLNNPNEDIHFEPIKTFLSLAFKPHIEESDQIYVNTELVEAYKYNIMEHTKKNIHIKRKDIEIKGWFGILVKGQERVFITSVDTLLFGACLYRKGQLVEAFYKGFLPSEHRSFGNVIGEFSIEPLAVNYTKKGVNVTDPVWKTVEKIMKEEIAPFKNASQKLHTKTVRGVKISNEVAVKNMYKSLGKKPDGTLLSENETPIEVEDEDEIEVTATPPIDEKNPISLVEDNVVKIKDVEINFVFIPRSDNETPWKWYNQTMYKNTLNIYLNKEFRLYKDAKTAKEKKMLYVLALAEELRKIVRKTTLHTEEICKKNVYEWITMNYDLIKIPG